MKHCFIYLFLTAAAFMCGGMSYLASEPSFQKSTLQITTQDRRQITFDIRIARTQRQRQLGLMHVKNMPATEGTLFLEPKNESRIVSMWMKNTYIPLDMLFIDESGLIVHIHKGAKPHDLTSISSMHPVMAVLEINAGLVDRLNINLGDNIANFKKYWP